MYTASKYVHTMQVSALPATQKKEEPTEAGTWKGIAGILTQAGVADVAEVCYACDLLHM